MKINAWLFTEMDYFLPFAMLVVEWYLHDQKLCFLLTLPIEIRLFQSLNYQEGNLNVWFNQERPFILYLIPLSPYLRTWRAWLGATSCVSDIAPLCPFCKICSKPLTAFLKIWRPPDFPPFSADTMARMSMGRPADRRVMDAAIWRDSICSKMFDSHVSGRALLEGVN